MNPCEKEINRLTLKSEGILLEYEYVNQLKDKRLAIQKEEFQKEIQLLQEQKQQLQLQVQSYQNRIESIENSRWWKLRKMIKGQGR